MADSREVHQIEYRWHPARDLCPIASSMSPDSTRGWDSRIRPWVGHPAAEAPAHSVCYQSLPPNGSLAALAFRYRMRQQAQRHQPVEGRPLVSRVLVGNASLLTPEVAMALCRTGLPSLAGERPGQVAAGAGLPSVNADDLASLAADATPGLDDEAAWADGLSQVIAMALAEPGAPLAVEVADARIRGDADEIAPLLWGLCRVVRPLLGTVRRGWSFSTYQPPPGFDDLTAVPDIVFREAGPEPARSDSPRREAGVRVGVPGLSEHGELAGTSQAWLADWLVAEYRAAGGEAITRLVAECAVDQALQPPPRTVPRTPRGACDGRPGVPGTQLSPGGTAPRTPRGVSDGKPRVSDTQARLAVIYDILHARWAGKPIEPPRLPQEPARDPAGEPAAEPAVADTGAPAERGSGANAPGPSLTDSRYVAGSLTDGRYVAGSLTDSRYAAGSLTDGRYVAGSLTDGRYVADSLTDSRYVAGSLTDGRYVAGSQTGGRYVALGAEGDGHGRPDADPELASPPSERLAEPADPEPPGGEPARGEPPGGEPARGEPPGGEPARGEPPGGEPARGEPAGGRRAGDEPDGQPAADERAGGELSRSPRPAWVAAEAGVLGPLPRQGTPPPLPSRTQGSFQRAWEQRARDQRWPYSQAQPHSQAQPQSPGAARPAASMPGLLAQLAVARAPGEFASVLQEILTLAGVPEFGDRASARRLLSEVTWCIGPSRPDDCQLHADELSRIFQLVVIPDLDRPRVVKEIADWAATAPPPVIRGLLASAQARGRADKNPFPQLISILEPMLARRWIEEHGLQADWNSRRSPATGRWWARRPRPAAP